MTHPEAQRTHKLRIPWAPRTAPSRISVDGSEYCESQHQQYFTRDRSFIDTSAHIS